MGTGGTRIKLILNVTLFVCMAYSCGMDDVELFILAFLILAPAIPVVYVVCEFFMMSLWISLINSLEC